MNNVPPIAIEYVSSASVAQACGLSVIQIENHFTPEDWGSPRDFVWDGHKYRFAVGSLQRLADSLHAHGQHDAAICLRGWIPTITRLEVPELGAPVAVEHAEISSEEFAEKVARARRRHPSDREASWAKKLEDAHQ